MSCSPQNDDLNLSNLWVEKKGWNYSSFAQNEQVLILKDGLRRKSLCQLVQISQCRRVSPEGTETSVKPIGFSVLAPEATETRCENYWLQCFVS